MPLDRTPSRTPKAPRAPTTTPEAPETSTAPSPTSAPLPFSSSEVPVTGHLVGHDLGGSESPDNLVAGSSESNTSQAKLEEAIKRL